MADPKPNFLRPTNVKSPSSREFWQGLRNRQFLVRECRSCDSVFFPPRSLCPNCVGDDLGWREIRGSGTLHSWTEVRLASPEFDTPFVLGLIDLPDGCGRLVAKIVDAEAGQLKIGMPVSIRYVDVGEDLTLYCIAVEQGGASE